ncbi:MAG: HTH domain-containing protein [Chloroflexi bacterium]|nr:HTH domain-containing protein [Chloroflexota bacterium]
MLLRILEVLRETGGAITLQDLEARVHVSREVLRDQLALLEKKGYVRREQWGGTCPDVEPGQETQSPACRLCPLKVYCAPSRAPLGTVYRLVDDSHLPSG